jgi:cytochrome c oxidase subunit IV
MAHGTYEERIKMVWRVCYILAFVTVFEIAAALLYYFFFEESVPRIILNLLFIILSAGKAYYIMSEFMHLKYELRPMMISIVTPFLFLVWGIITFLWEGDYWLSAKEFWNNLP